MHGWPLLSGDGNPVADKNRYLSLIDVVPDPTKAVESFEFRSVTTQSLLGILDATIVEADGCNLNSCKGALP